MSHEVEEMMKDVNAIVGSSKTESDVKNDEFIAKKEAVQHTKVENEYAQLVTNSELIESFNHVSLETTPEILEQAKQDNNTYFKNAKEKRFFLNQPVFHGAIPFHGKNIILIGAVSGSGKTTISANLAFHDIMQKGKTLILSNEETREDCFNRVSCLAFGWHYQNHGDFTQERIDALNASMIKLSPYMSVITDSSKDIQYGITTTLEGVIGVLNKAMQDYRDTGEFYSSIMIDYYQGVTRSLRNPRLTSWECQEQLSLFLDQFKNIYPGPIVILSQLKPGDDDFKTRIEGRKMVYNKATVAVEVITDKANLATNFKLHKGRYSSALGQSIAVGYNNGMYVKYDSAFVERVEMLRVRKDNMAKIGSEIKELGGEKDEKNDEKPTSST